MHDRAATGPHPDERADPHGKRRALIELAVAYVLILAVIWSSRPLQRYLWLLAVAAVAFMFWRSWEGRKSVGLRRTNFLSSLWVALAAAGLAGAAVLVAIHLHTLDLPDPPHTGLASADNFFGHVLLFLRSYWGYALWTFVQQFLLQGFFLLRLLRLLPSPRIAAFAAAGLFALAHIPNPILTVATLVWGFAACLLFLRYRNLYTLAIAHAILGVTIAITVPGPVVRNMRVGLGYLAYARQHNLADSLKPEGPDGVH